LSANPLATLGKLGDLKRRLIFLLGALIVYRIGAHIPVPGIDPSKLAELFRQNSGGILDMFNMFSGGALSRFTILALGIMPYISSSIIMQLLTVVSPSSRRSRRKARRAGARSRIHATAPWCCHLQALASHRARVAARAW
jgi:preprotein translocase subunit SecY